ncbi:hypothetical protein BD410DRAFT_791564 [Rickenella mellea]|uniref:Uncharacterized protein n=1 Tax=Rickenella mellea TaxID=50990 RepID=A0A4Y7PY08_9AGAM|nr:hypothetical protein BD410DRAFT_791564 [Rickenella mellea]
MHLGSASIIHLMKPDNTNSMQKHPPPPRISRLNCDILAKYYAPTPYYIGDRVPERAGSLLGDNCLPPHPQLSNISPSKRA